MEKNIWICPLCGSINVDARAWVNINTREIDSLTESKDDSDYWCNDCENHIVPELKEN